MDLPDIDQRLKELITSEENLRKEVQAYGERIADLLKNKDDAERSLADAEGRALLAEDQARDANEKYKKALQLKDGQYEQLIRDLFEAPMNKLRETIEEQSNHSILVTLKVAVVSIVITLAVSVFPRGSTQESRGVSPPKGDLTTAGSGADPSRIEGRPEAIDEIARYLLIERLVDTVTAEKENFSNFKTKNDVATAYKLQIGSAFASARYEDFIRAFKRAGLAEETIPDSGDDLRRWDEEFVGLCQNAISVLEKRSGIQALMGSDRLYETFRSASDSTDYGKRQCPKSRQTYSKLLLYYRRELDRFQGRLELNR